MKAFVASLEGQANRVYLRDHSYTIGGSITSTNLAPELLAANYTVGNGPGAAVASNVSGGIRLKHSGSQAAIVWDTGGTSVTAGNSYALVTEADAGRGSPSIGDHYVDTTGSGGGNISVDASTSHPGRSVTGFTAPTSTVYAGVYGAANPIGDEWDLTHYAISRALLVDNGFNALTYSEAFDNAAWTKTNTTITANPSPGANAPDGTDTADEIVEDSTASSPHAVVQSYTRASVAEFWTGSISFKENTSQRIALRIDDGAGNSATAYFDANSGTITAGASAGGTATLPYATMHDAGNGWYRARISGKLPATTEVRLVAYLCDGAVNTISFNGDGTSGLYMWGAQLQRGGQLGRYVPITDTVSTGTSQTGSGCWVKGLDSDTAGQLVPGDWMEIQGSGLHQITSDLDSDESGVGYAQFTPPLRSSPSDEAAVVLHQPSMKAVLSSNDVGWSNRIGDFSDFSIEAREIIE
jgi:hypothetical protein